MRSSLSSAADDSSASGGIPGRTQQAYVLTQEAAGALADLFVSKAKARLEMVELAEQELDRIDREIDSVVAAAVTECDQEQARELLTCMKMVIDLERICDLLASVAASVVTLGDRLQAEDAGELIRMATLLEHMLAETHGGFAERDLDRALAALRMDSEVDRLRSRMMIRHLERAAMEGPHNGVHVLFMAQGLERAGDHVKNLAEEICHLVSGRTLRHAVPGPGHKSQEQIYTERLRQQQGSLSDSGEPERSATP
jgi:phosphate transport system protein